jgi:hypothetical protein
MTQSLSVSQANSIYPDATPKAKPRLFDIVRAIHENIEDNEGEVTDELNALELDIELKVQAYHHVVLEKRALAKAKKESAQHFAKGAATAERAADAIEERLFAALQELGKQRIETPTCTACIEKSESVKVADEALFLETAADRFVKPGVATIRKAEIAKALKAGEAVDGAELVESKYLRFR